MRGLFLFPFQMLVLVAVQPVSAESIDPVAILAPSDVPEGYWNEFGSSIAVSGDYVVVGARYDPYFNGNWDGAAYVFRRHADRWIEQTKLTGSQTGFHSQLGFSVDIDGDVIVAGAPRWEFNTCGFDRPGSVYVFRRDDQGTPNDPADDTWSEEAILTVSDPRISEFFGMSVAVSGDVIVVGGQCANTVEVFRRSGRKWRHADSLVAPDAMPGDRLGFSVDVDGDRIVAGAHGDDERRGAAYVFQRSPRKWTYEAKLTAPVAAPIDDLGKAVSISGSSVVVGARNTDEYGASSGSAYVYTATDPGTWILQAKLAAPDAATGQKFGTGVGIDSDLVLVGRIGNPWSFLYTRNDHPWDQVAGLSGVDGVIASATSVHGNFGAVIRYIYAVRNHHTLRNFASFQNCFRNKLETGLSPTCQPHDLTADETVDLDDFEDFIGTLVGP